MLKLIRHTALVVISMGLFPAIALAQGPSILDPASPAARSIANLHTIVLWIASGVFAVVCILLAYSLIRFRRRSEDDPEPDQSFHGNATLETIWTLIPIGILVVVMVLTFQTFNDIDPNRPTDMTVRVTGKQWVWEVEYPEQGIKQIAEMRIPINTDVRVEIESADVLHSLWVPQLAGKKDAIPGYQTVSWFRADRLGTFHGQCAEYCGLGHSSMPIKVVVMDQTSFDIWLDANTVTPEE
ncbi:MAG: cytochrome c oxidase subunit II [Chloroflexota bacterium]